MPGLALPIRFKVPAAVIGLSLLVAALTLSMAYLTERSLASEDARNQLARLADTEAAAISTWFSGVSADATGLAASPAITKSMAQLRAAVREMGDTANEQMRETYITNNPYAAAERWRLVLPETPGNYDHRHETLHSYVERIITRAGYSDLLLISTTGQVIYSFAKEDDFGSNVITGLYKTSALAKVFTRARSLKPGEIAVADFERYAPAGGVPSLLLAVPIDDSYGNLAGILAVRLPATHLDQVVDAGLSGLPRAQAYVTGADGLARAGGNIAGLGPLEPLKALPPPSSALDETTTRVASDVQLQSGLTGYATSRNLDLPGGLSWIVRVELDTTSAMAGPTEFLRRSMTYGVGALIIVGVAGLLLARSITLPVARLSHAMAQIGMGDLQRPVADTARGDEVGAMARSLDGLRLRLAAAQDEEARQQAARNAADAAVDRLRQALQQLSAGDLTLSLDAPFPPVMDRLRLDFNQAIAQMNDVMGDVVRAAASINHAAAAVGSSATDLSHRTETQAATLEQTAGAMDELTASVRGTAEGARHAERITQDARTEAGQSAVVVQAAVAAMNEIETSARHISQIIGVIDDIAFQTSLLALNAGVEAARAGDAGRGFAVVASEVRALAQRSSAAAKEIKTLIAVSDQQVEIGVARVAETGESLARIVRRGEEIAALVSGIAKAAAEQSSGLSEVNAGVIQLDTATQQNAAMAAEAENTSQTMAQEAVHLQGLVARFRTIAPSITAPRPAPAAELPFRHVGKAVAFTPASVEARLPAAGADLAPRRAPVVSRGAAASLAQWDDF